jgi:hypothetical protein
MVISRYTLATARIAVSATLLFAHSTGAQQRQDPGAATSAAPSAVDACNQFRNALNPPAQAGQQAAPDRAQQSLGRIAEAGQQGITCAQALARYFESLRKGGAKGTWSDIEKEMDLVIDSYRALLERIEGTDGAYEEGQRAVTVLNEQIKDITARRGETHENVINARRTRDKIAASLEQTKNLKAVLDNVLVEMQGRKSEIVEAEGVQRYSAAQKALEDMNVGLAKVIDGLVKAIRKSGS